MKTQDYIALARFLKEYSITVQFEEKMLLCTKGEHTLRFTIAGEHFDPAEHREDPVLHEDQLQRSPEKIAAIILSKLKCNTTVFARSCEVKKVSKADAVSFLDAYHIMNSTQSAFNLGLFYKQELVALATFSKGRKMNRLHAGQRSFELIRFCCRSGITVTGGLTRLVKNFCEEKKAGDVMTYVDKHLSDGRSFLNAGFKKLGETEPHYFLVNRKSFERRPALKEEIFDHSTFYLSRNAGNSKLVYTPGIRSVQQ